ASPEASCEGTVACSTAGAVGVTEPEGCAGLVACASPKEDISATMAKNVRVISARRASGDRQRMRCASRFDIQILQKDQKVFELFGGIALPLQEISEILRFGRARCPCRPPQEPSTKILPSCRKTGQSSFCSRLPCSITTFSRTISRCAAISRNLG